MRGVRGEDAHMGVSNGFANAPGVMVVHRRKHIRTRAYFLTFLRLAHAFFSNIFTSFPHLRSARVRGWVRVCDAKVI